MDCFKNQGFEDDGFENQWLLKEGFEVEIFLFLATGFAEMEGNPKLEIRNKSKVPKSKCSKRPLLSRVERSFSP